MIEPCIQVRLQFLYPKAGSSFFRARDFMLSGAQISRTGLFGHAPDIAGVVLAMDCMHIHFNERDSFSVAGQNDLRIEFIGADTPRPEEIWIAEYGGFTSEPVFHCLNGGYQIELIGQKVSPEHFLRLEWTFMDSNR